MTALSTNAEMFRRALGRTMGDVRRVLDRLLPPPDGPEGCVAEAMRYAVLGGGKGFRPFLVRQSAQLFGVDDDCALRTGAAVECIHAYSLIHDDLPCMDDSALRRGRAAVHMEFGSAVAMLAGNALLTLAFDLLADPQTHGNARVRCELIAALAQASGAQGMIGGQAMDVSRDRASLGISGVTRMQRLKTGALIALSCEAGAILGHASAEARHALHAYAHDMGLAFQIADDLLDVEGAPEATGKDTGRDAAGARVSFVSILGPARAREQARMLCGQAVEHLQAFDRNADLLRQAARFVITRQA